MMYVSFAELMNKGIERRIAVMPFVSGFGIYAGQIYTAYRYEVRGTIPQNAEPFFLIARMVWLPIKYALFAN